jgi:hypothetical protein
MKKIMCLLLLFSLLAACAPQPSTSGIRGEVSIGPMCPVIQEGVPCPDQPYQAELTVLTTAGRRVLRFTTDEAGKFAVNLRPGDYILHAESPDGGSMPYAEDVPFTVHPDSFTVVNVFFDSGIR